MSLAPDPALIAVAAVALALIVGYYVGAWANRRREDDLIAAAAEATLAELVAAQEADDRNALASLPPGIDAGDVWELAGRRGISIAEAAEILFVGKAGARLRANVRRHHGGGPR